MARTRPVWTTVPFCNTADQAVAQHHNGNTSIAQIPLDAADVVLTDAAGYAPAPVVAARLQDDKAGARRNTRFQPVQHLAGCVAIDAGVANPRRNTIGSQHALQVLGICFVPAHSLSPGIARTKRNNLDWPRMAGQRLHQHARCHVQDQSQMNEHVLASDTRCHHIQHS